MTDEEERDYYTWYLNRNDFDFKRRWPLERLQKVIVVGQLEHSGSSDTSPTLSVNPHRRVELFNPGPQTAAGDAFAVSTDVPSGNYEILGILYDALMDANAADRVCNVYVNRSLSAASAAENMWKSDNLTLSANQYGYIEVSMGQGGFHTLNDNGTLSTSAAANGPLPLILGAGDSIVASCTLVKAGDLQSLRVWYRRLS